MQTKINPIIVRKLERIRNGANPRVLDLFAGAGGLSLGFLTAGFDVVAALEIDAQAASTHALNFFRNSPPEVRQLHARPRDITLVEPDELMREYGYEDPADAVDVIIGGPPCQAFARVGRAKLREVANHPEAFRQDPRGNLYLRFIHYVEQLQPLAILMENVPDALNYGGHNIAEETCEVLSSNGLHYRCAYTLLNSAFYGVPQMRERMFVLAYAEELNCSPAFPAPTNWIQLPDGYQGTRGVALQSLRNYQQSSALPQGEAPQPVRFYTDPPAAAPDLPPAVTAEQALGDLPPIYARELYASGKLTRGVQDPGRTVRYPLDAEPAHYGFLMRNWPGFQTGEEVTGHIIRYLPRDFKLFARLEPGDQYPQAHRRAIEMFREEIDRRRMEGLQLELSTSELAGLMLAEEELPEELSWVQAVWDEFVPPYDPTKFPNKWRKMESFLPARTLMAHIGKDSYSHIHYDSLQARTISVREAARIMSFPDGFLFSGKMNAAFKQAGNAVPPLLSYRIATKVKEAFGQQASPIP